MSLEKRLLKIKVKVEVLHERYVTMKKELDEGFKERLMRDIESEVGGALSQDLTWKLRDLFLNTNRLSTIQTPLAILESEEYSDEEKMERLKRFAQSLIDQVMMEDTLNYSTSPESNLNRRAQYMAYREIYRGVGNYILEG